MFPEVARVPRGDELRIVQSQYLDLFVTFLRAERNLSPKSVDAYATDVRAWLMDLAERGVQR